MALGMYEGMSTPHRLVLRSLWCDLATRRRPFLAAFCKCLRPQIAEVCFWCFDSYLSYLSLFLQLPFVSHRRWCKDSMVSDQMWSFKSLLPEALDRELGRKDQVWSVFMSVSSGTASCSGYGSNAKLCKVIASKKKWNFDSSTTERIKKYGDWHWLPSRTRHFPPSRSPVPVPVSDGPKVEKR